MTLDELNEEYEAKKDIVPPKPLLCLPPHLEVEVPEEMTCDLPGHVFLAQNEEGKMMFMTITDDGRKVPLENW